MSFFNKKKQIVEPTKIFMPSKKIRKTVLLKLFGFEILTFENIVEKEKE